MREQSARLAVAAGARRGSAYPRLPANAQDSSRWPQAATRAPHRPMRPTAGSAPCGRRRYATASSWRWPPVAPGTWPPSLRARRPSTAPGAASATAGSGHGNCSSPRGKFAGSRMIAGRGQQHCAANFARRGELLNVEQLHVAARRGISQYRVGGAQVDADQVLRHWPSPLPRTSNSTFQRWPSCATASSSSVPDSLA